MRLVEHLGRSSKAKNRINAEKVKYDGWTDGPTDEPTDRPTKQGVEKRSTRLKMKTLLASGSSFE